MQRLNGIRSTATLRHSGREHGDRGSPPAFAISRRRSTQNPPIPAVLFNSGPRTRPSLPPRLFNDRHAPGRHLFLLPRLAQLLQRPPAPVCLVVRPALLSDPVPAHPSCPPSRQESKPSDAGPLTFHPRLLYVSLSSLRVLRDPSLTSMSLPASPSARCVPSLGPIPPRSTTTPAACRALQPRTAVSILVLTSAPLRQTIPPCRSVRAPASTRPGPIQTPQTSRPLAFPPPPTLTPPAQISTLPASSSRPSRPLSTTVTITAAPPSRLSTRTAPPRALAFRTPSTAQPNPLPPASPPTSSLPRILLPTRTRSPPAPALRLILSLACIPAQ